MGCKPALRGQGMVNQRHQAQARRLGAQQLRHGAGCQPIDQHQRLVGQCAQY